MHGQPERVSVCVHVHVHMHDLVLYLKNLQHVWAPSTSEVQQGSGFGASLPPEGDERVDL